MFKLNLRVYGILNEFLPVEMRYRLNSLKIAENTTISSLLNFQGIPKEGINLITVNNIPVNDSYIITCGDIISLYPEFKNISKKFLIKKLNEKKRVGKFLLPNELFELSKFLKGLGFDVKLCDLEDFNAFSNLLISEDRVGVISIKINSDLKEALQDSELYLLNSIKLSEQIKELLHLFVPPKSPRLFNYCSNCERELTENSRREKIYQLLNDFNKINSCSICKKSLNLDSTLDYVN